MRKVELRMNEKELKYKNKGLEFFLLKEEKKIKKD